MAGNSAVQRVEYAGDLSNVMQPSNRLASIKRTDGVGLHRVSSEGTSARRSMALTELGQIGHEDPSIGWSAGVIRPRYLEIAMTKAEVSLLLLRQLMVFPLLVISRAGSHEGEGHEGEGNTTTGIFLPGLDTGLRVPRLLPLALIVLCCAVAADRQRRGIWNVIHPYVQTQLSFCSVFEYEYWVLPFMALGFPLLFSRVGPDYVDCLWFTPYCFHSFAIVFGTAFTCWRPTENTMQGVQHARRQLLQDYDMAKPILDLLDVRAAAMVEWQKVMTIKGTLFMFIAAIPNGVAEMRTVFEYFSSAIPDHADMSTVDPMPVYIMCFVALCQGIANMLFYYVWMVHGVMPWLAENASFMISL